MSLAQGLPPRTLFTRVFAAAALLCGAALAAALVTQHVFDMQPCPWCVLQRLIFSAIGAAALLGLLLRAPALRSAAAALMLALSGAGIAAALWQHFVASSSTSCKLTWADRIMSFTGLDLLWPEVFAAWASCADVAVRLFGLPYEFWSLMLFALLGAAALMLLLRRKEGRAGG